MLQGSGPGNLPLWISTRIDDEAVEHYRDVGRFTPREDREALTVEIVQRDDLSPDGDPARIRRNPAQVRMIGIRLSPDEARELARLLNRAATLITDTTYRDLPRRNSSRSWNGGYGLAPRRSPAPAPTQRRSADRPTLRAVK
jgi:hypothetical protein